MGWILANAWDATFVGVVIGEVSKLLAFGLILAATVFVIGYVLNRLLGFLEYSR